MTQPALESLCEGRYHLLRVLGAGGMATVYKAYDERLDVFRAIKILAPHMAAHPKTRGRFATEARTMARMHHHNLVTVHDVGDDEGHLYIVMEVVGGGSFQERLDAHGPLPPRMAADAVRSVLGALAYAHSKNVVHRDIKPHNVLVTHDGVPKLTDFGIAQVTGTDSSTTKTGAMLGTWAYMAPEQRSDAKSADHRADIYATGGMLYALVTGKEPFDLYSAELHEDLFKGVDSGLRDVIVRATRYKPVDRFETADQMAEALDAIMADLPEIAPDVPPLAVRQEEEEEEPPVQPATDTGMFVRAHTGRIPVATPHVTLAPMDEQAPMPAPATLADLGSGATFDASMFDSGRTLAPRTVSDFSIDEATSSTSLGDTPTLRDDKGKGRRSMVVWALAGLGLGVVAVAGLGVAAVGTWLASADNASVTGAPTERAGPLVVTTSTRKKDAKAAASSGGSGEAGEDAAVGADGSASAEGDGQAPVGDSSPAKASSTGASSGSGKASSSASGSTTASASSGSRASSSGGSSADHGSQGSGEAAAQPEAVKITGELLVNSIPWGTFTLNGRDYGRVRYGLPGELPAGSYEIVITSKDGEVHTDRVDLDPGEVERFCWDFHADKACAQ